MFFFTKTDNCVTGCDLSFYPPHPKERTSTIGIVTLNNQMVLTVQQSGSNN